MDTCMMCFARKPTEAYLTPGIRVCNACRYKLNASVNFLSFYGVEPDISGTMAETPVPNVADNGAKPAEKAPRTAKTPDPV